MSGLHDLDERALLALRALARRLTGCGDLAEDVVQEALIALWEAPAAPAKREAWLRAVVERKALQRLRALARRRAHECSAGAPCPLALDPARALERAEVRARVRAALARLPERYRAPLRLHELEGLDYRAVGAALGLPLGTVRSRLARGRARLRALLEAERSSERDERDGRDLGFNEA